MIRFLMILLVTSLAFVSVAEADIRVLFRFDESGHEVHRVFSMAPRISFKQSSVDSSDGEGISARRRNLSQQSMSPIEAGRSASIGIESESFSRSKKEVGEYCRLDWYDAAGNRISTTQAPDPRITRSISHINSNSDVLAVVKQGGWVATGPDEATYVQVFLPQMIALALGPEQWHVDLERE